MYRIIGSDGKEYGPVSSDQLRQWIIQGRALASTRVLPEGSPEWKLIGSLPEFSILFAAGQLNIPAGHQSPPVSARTSNGMAVAGFVLGLISFFSLPFSFFCCCLGLPFNLFGILFSIIGLSQIRGNPQRYDGRGFAIAGLVLSVLGLILYLVLLAIGVISSQWQHEFTHHGQRL